MVVASPRIKAFQGAGEMEPMTAVGQAHHFRDARAMYVLPRLPTWQWASICDAMGHYRHFALQKKQKVFADH